MRQTHVGGDKLFMDYAGDTVSVIIERLTGEVRPAQIFVAVMCASNFTHVQATWTQGGVPTPSVQFSSITRTCLRTIFNAPWSGYVSVGASGRHGARATCRLCSAMNDEANCLGNSFCRLLRAKFVR